MDLGDFSLPALMQHPVAGPALSMAMLLGLAGLVHVVTRSILLAAVRKLVTRTRTDWDDALVEARVFSRLAYLAPALVVWNAVHLFPNLPDIVDVVVARVASASVLLFTALAVAAFLSAVNEIYSRNPQNRSRPIKGYIQVAKIVLFVLSAILILATLMDKSPLIFLSGLGAMAAVLLIVFRDTLLSLVASVQLTGNDMVHVGDWIEMPQYGADGDVIDIALHTIKIQNFDKTITTIPTHRLIEGSFKNWRGMSSSGGRRIKRSFLVDANTVRFLEESEVDRLGHFALLEGYMRRKREEIVAWNAEAGRNPEIVADIRRLTNIGTLRAYVEGYLHSRSDIHEGMTLMVRQLAPTESGIPLELYCFTNVTDWGIYEGIQADIMDHIYAVLPEFGLRLFQATAGADIAALAERGESS